MELPGFALACVMGVKTPRRLVSNRYATPMPQAR
jgi:hypothetical protein